MIIDVKVPALSESVPDATLIEWKKQAGDAVTQGEILIELETDKVVLEVPAPESGVLTELLKQNGDIALSEEALAHLDTEGAATSPTPVAEAVAETPTASAEPAIKLSPAVRKLVDEHGLDPAAISGTGKDGRLTKGDVLAHMDLQAVAKVAPAPTAAPTSPAPAPVVIAPTVAGERQERRVPMTRLRSRIAERLLSAQQNAAILTTFNEINMQPVMELRARHRDQFEKTHGARLGFMSFFIRAATLALAKFPEINAYIDGSDTVYHDYCDIGVAVGSPRGLVVPVLRDADKLSFAQIEGNIAAFGAKAKDGTLSIEDMTGGTFTISNGGIFGSLLSTPILNPPQSGILGMHKIEQRPVVEDGEIVIRPMMYLALSYDHRIVDGREAVQFLVAIKDALEDPGRMLLEV